MSQAYYGTCIFITLMVFFLLLQVVESAVSHQRNRAPELQCLLLAIMCGIITSFGSDLRRAGAGCCGRMR